MEPAPNPTRAPFGARLTKRWALVCRKEQKGLFMALHLCREQGWRWRLGHLGQSQLSRHGQAYYSTGTSLEPRGSPASHHSGMAQPTKLGRASNRAGVSWVMGRLWTPPRPRGTLGLGHIPMGDFFQVSLLSRQKLGMAGIRGLSHSWSLPTTALAPTSWEMGKVSVGGPGLGGRSPGHEWSPLPCSPRTDPTSWVEPPLQWGCSS